MKLISAFAILTVAVSAAALVRVDGVGAGRAAAGSGSATRVSAGARAPRVTPGPSLVSVSGRQLIVRRRNRDGTLAPAAPYVIRGVGWSPAGRDTVTSKTDPGNAAVRRQEFGLWAATDIPLLKNMRVNTVRTFIDPGLDATGTAVLDQLYDNGIMVVMTVDDGVNNLTRVEQAVNFYKNHPAVLGWMLGSEWNINRYFGVASSVQDAAQRTQTAAALVKSLDANHPVMTSYGDIDIAADGLRLADTQRYVNEVCPAVDAWALNVYRGNDFGTLFEQWRAIAAKPMLVGEFGTDAFRSEGLGGGVPGNVDEALQAQWGVSEWNHLFGNLSAEDPAGVALGGFVFELNDEWWKVAPARSQQPFGFTLFGGHPDDYANEEYFGVLDIDRQPRAAYGAFAAAFDPAYRPPQDVTYRTVSKGFQAQDYNGQCGVAWFFEDGEKLYRATGCGGGGRGFNVAAFDACSGALRHPVQHFDTYATRQTGDELNNLINFLDGLPNGTVVLIAVADEGGLNSFPPNDCVFLNNRSVQPFLQRLEALGARQIRNYCYRNSYALAAVKGEGAARSEQLASGVAATAQATLPAPFFISPAGQSFIKDGGAGTVRVTAPPGCGWAGGTDDGWITITSGGGAGDGTLNYSVGVNPDAGFRTGTITVAGQRFAVIQSAATTALRLDAVSPAAGRAAGGQQLRLVGAFAGLSAVLLGGTPADWSYSNGGGDTSVITVNTPPHAPGAVSIELRPASGVGHTRANAFAYLPTVFTDDTLTAGATPVRAQHVLELRQAVDALRAVAGLAPATWADAELPSAGLTIRVVHVLELRNHLEDAAARLGYPPGQYTEPTLSAGSVIRRVHVQELRLRIRNIAG